MALGIALVESMMRDAMKMESKYTIDDKIKLLGVYSKIKLATNQMKQGGMGRGFDNPDEDEEAAL
jgi:hypothetical protein